MNELLALAARVPAEEVVPRRYFLQELSTPGALWCLRIAGIAAAILLLLLCIKTK